MALLSKPWTSAADAAQFRERYLKMLPLLHFNYSAINPIAVKSLMKACGLPAGALHRPLRALAGDALAQGMRIVRELGLDHKFGYRMQTP